MISIIVPIYYVEKFLPCCLDSILAQSCRDFELLLVDDGSPDESGKICDAYALKDSRITVIHQSNAGVSAARNAGLDRAEGEYVGFVDPDDFIEADMFKKMLEAIDGAELAICGYNYVDESGNVDNARLYQVKEKETLTQKQLMSRFSDMPPTVRLGVVNKLFRRDLIGNLRFDGSLKSAEDVLFLTEYSAKVKRAVFVHCPLYLNTVRQGSATHGGLSAESLFDSFVPHRLMYEATVSRYPDLKQHSLAFLLDVCVMKYNECLAEAAELPKEEKAVLTPKLKQMHSFIRSFARQALTNREIYWKTRIRYLL